MSAGFCSVCGAVLRDGVCPNGHPQRADRLRDRQKRGWPTALVLSLSFLLLAGVAYAALVWYPRRAAADLMGPSSEEFVGAVQTYRAAVATFPPGPTDPQALVDASNLVVSSAGGVRDTLGRAAARLEQRRPADWPVISSRPALAQARATRDTMLSFYTASLETVAALEGVAGYVTQVAPVLPQFDNVEQALGSPAPDEVGAAVAAATPIADQALANLQAITPPEEMGGLHASLLAIAQRIREDLDEISRAGQTGSAPVLRALVRDVRGEIVAFRDTLGRAPRDAGEAGLGDRLAQVDSLVAQVIAGLEALRGAYGIAGIMVPPSAPTPGVGV